MVKKGKKVKRQVLTGHSLSNQLGFLSWLDPDPTDVCSIRLDAASPQ
jgi:hypothetical protein